MLAGIALAALLVGGIQTAMIVTDNNAGSAQDHRAPVVEVQKVQTVDEHGKR